MTEPTLFINYCMYGGSDVTSVAQTLFPNGINIPAGGYVNLFNDPFYGEYKDFLSSVIDYDLSPATIRVEITDNDHAHVQLPGALQDANRSAIQNTMPNYIAGYYELWVSMYSTLDVQSITNPMFENTEENGMYLAPNLMLGTFGGVDPLTNVLKALEMFGYLVKDSLVWRSGFWYYESEYVSMERFTLSS